MPSTRATHHGVNDADSNHDDRSPTTTARDALSRARTPSPTRSTSSRPPRGKGRRHKHARSNSTESRRPRGMNGHRKNARSSSTESSWLRGQDRHRRLARSSSTESSHSRGQDLRRRHARSSCAESSLPQGEDRRGRYACGSRSRSGTEEGNRDRNHQQGKRTRDSSWEHPRSRSRSRSRRGHTARDHARIQKIVSRKHHEGDRRAWTTPRPNRGDRRGRSHDPRMRSRGRRCQSRSKRGHGHSPQRQRDAPRTPKRNRRAYTTEDLREEQERTDLREAIHILRKATQNLGRVAGPPRGDTERYGALRGQHTHANPGGGGARIEAPPLMTVPTRGDAGRNGALRGQHTPANPEGGPWIEAPPLMTAHEAGRYGRVCVEAPKTIDQLRQLITGGIWCPVFSGSKAGELSICNNAVMLQDKIARTLSSHELGELRLPRDDQDARGFHIHPDAYTFRRGELLIGLVGDNLLTHCQLTASEPV